MARFKFDKGFYSAKEFNKINFLGLNDGDTIYFPGRSAGLGVFFPFYVF